MDSNTKPQTEVLHSDNHSKLSAEQIAKAVARHNRDHSGAPATPADSAKAASAKAKKAKKS